ncbi:MAG: PE-PPE domain-containing protein [Mycobacterium sp.]|uniref:PE-PPE domain-containing protein n=1 Tax=Mycobacterium sp. TaxID=1785 RepID=UPI003C4E34C4
MQGRSMLRVSLATGVAITGASLIPVTAPSPASQARDVVLTSGDTADSALGGGTAFVMGGSGLPIPPPSYVEAVDRLYLEPRGFTGTPQALDTPEGLYPVTGVHSLPFDTSAAQGQEILDAAILHQIATGHVDAANPVVVFGLSQSSVIASTTMTELANQGVPSDDVHFVLIGDESNPDGGVLERFDLPVGSDPSFPSLGFTLTGATPADLYPTDIYTQEYDGFSDFPRYPLNLISDLNALLGIPYDHGAYLGDTPEQIASAIQLPTSAADTLTNYYIIPDDSLPLLDPLRLLPVIGQPLYDLLEPDARILVNLGYGSITDGWDQGYADIPTTLGLFPTNLDGAAVSTALSNGLQQGISTAVQDLENPANYQITPLEDNPSLLTLLTGAFNTGLTDTLHPSPMQLFEILKEALGGAANFPISDATLLSSPTDIVNDLTGTLAADYAALVPIADTVNALLTSLPAYDASMFVDQMDAGNLINAIGDPIAADVVMLPFILLLGTAVPIAEATAGTLVNLVDLFQ